MPTSRLRSNYNYELEAEKLYWKAHAKNKLFEFQKLVARYEQITDRPHAIICAYRWLERDLL